LTEPDLLHESSSKSLWQNYLDAALDPTETDYGKELELGGHYAVGSEHTAKVPALFFRHDFDLANPLIWESLNRSPQVDAAPTDDTAIIHLLSDHLDVLETHLVQEVSHRAPVFFSALTNLQNLTSQSMICLEQITSLQATLEDLDTMVSLQGLLVVDTQHDLEQCRQVSSSLAAIQVAVDSVYLAKQLSQNQDWMGALEALSEFQRWCLKHDGNQTSTERQTLAGQRELRNREASISLPILPEILEEMNGDSSASGSISPTFAGAASRERMLPLALASLSSIQDVINSLRPLTDIMRTEMKAALSQYFNSVLERQAAIPGNNRGITPNTSMLASLVQPILRAFDRCGGSQSDVVELWRIVCLKAVREGMRNVGTNESSSGLRSHPGSEAAFAVRGSTA
jgi:hypothetical protein